ncbi:hypothetical protein LPUS_07721 [Lasallia pustulata]|uniref:Uncharacterized protein n=1 Tax=Lasallia pustulata TaxID=136370 RepID=A0A1W5D3U9_9LECA|nr:hypothetical protein LPUS_07721 [Lasallia pustulata]
MEVRHQDAVLCITLGLCGYFAARLAHQQLSAVRTAVEVTEEEKPQELINQQTENSLKLDTLRQLAEGSNHDIRAAALKIITERSIQGATFDLIIRDIAGRDIERRDKALTSLTFLIASPARFSLNKRETYEALIDCLCNFLPSYQEKDWPFSEYTNIKFRTQAEKDALIALGRILPYNISQALSAGIVSRWLAKYPFCGSSLPEALKKIEAVQQLKTWNTEDTLMCDILSMIDCAPDGRKELRKHRLVGSAIGETDDEEGDTLMIGGEDTAGLSFGSVARGRRIREESIEEQALRRRRREAMVLSERGRPLGREDIIQRDNTVSDEDVEQDLERLIEHEARREDLERAPSASEHGWWGWTRWLFRSPA